MVEHFNSKPFEYRKGLLVQVAHHSATVPSGQEFNNIGVATAYQQSHGATGAKAPGADGHGCYARDVLEETCVPAEDAGDLVSFDRDAHVMGVVIGC